MEKQECPASTSVSQKGSSQTSPAQGRDERKVGRNAAIAGAIPARVASSQAGHTTKIPQMANILPTTNIPQATIILHATSIPHTTIIPHTAIIMATITDAVTITDMGTITDMVIIMPRRIPPTAASSSLSSSTSASSQWKQPMD
ncbi:MAG: hypothetical protein JWR22_2506 [Herminiimonas sp.]|nr:hypothetical protein [Herminiimonas sp.]